ncbi:unnamed protein product [Mytilus coruscus]|uniref:Rad50/SbcC-type AAA domain-containing protein n=1 Tax=Mytilus coruscus TaxID=42192 RepID=A0A6J8BSY6_MYTCO|nr:unnamed protein product [Mytilus coruscus]
MLRQIRLRNFVKFNGSHEHRLDFPENGVYIFIGENNAGKSCIFEGIRRCMQTELNETESTRHDPDNILYVICLFEKANKDMLTSCFVSYKDGNDTVLCKIVFYKVDNENFINCSVRRTVNGTLESFHERPLSDKDTFYELLSKLLVSNVENKYETESFEIEDFCRKFCISNINDNNGIKDFDKLLKQIHFETIFANRGISPIQSSRQIPMNKGKNIYKSASDLA